MSTRKIKDAKDLESNELIYFKGHAKATYMSNGTNVEDALTKKQDEIKDLNTIRLNASRTIPSKTSELTNDSGFLTEHLDISHLATQSLLSSIDTELSELDSKVDVSSVQFPINVLDKKRFTVSHVGRIMRYNYSVAGNENYCIAYIPLDGLKTIVLCNKIDYSSSDRFFDYCFFTSATPDNGQFISGQGEKEVKSDHYCLKIIDVPEGAVCLGITTSYKGAKGDIVPEDYAYYCAFHAEENISIDKMNRYNGFATVKDGVVIQNNSSVFEMCTLQVFAGDIFRVRGTVLVPPSGNLLTLAVINNDFCTDFTPQVSHEILNINSRLNVDTYITITEEDNGKWLLISNQMTYYEVTGFRQPFKELSFSKDSSLKKQIESEVQPLPKFINYRPFERYISEFYIKNSNSNTTYALGGFEFIDGYLRFELYIDGTRYGISEIKDGYNEITYKGIEMYVVANTKDVSSSFIFKRWLTTDVDNFIRVGNLDLCPYIAFKLKESSLKKENTTLYVSNNNLLDRDIVCRYVNSLKVSEELLLANSKFAIRDTEEGKENTAIHDATIVKKGGLLYMISTCNNTGVGGDNPKLADTTVRLNVIDYNNPSVVNTYTPAKKGDTIDGLTLATGTGVPNMVLRDDTLCTWFTASDVNADTSVGYTGKWTFFYALFDTLLEKYTDVGICKFVYKGVEYDFNLPNIYDYVSIPQNNTKERYTHQYFNNNSTIGVYKGEYYIAVCAAGFIEKPIIFKTSDFKIWHYVTIPTFECYFGYETALFCKDGYLYVCTRGGDTNTLGKYNIANDEWVDYYYLPSMADSRPCFFNKNDKLYLWFTPCVGRNEGVIAEINETKLSWTKTMFNIYSGSAYPCVVNDTESDKLIVSRSTSQGISINEFSIPSISNDIVNEKFKEIFGSKVESSATGKNTINDITSEQKIENVNGSGFVFTPNTDGGILKLEKNAGKGSDDGAYIYVNFALNDEVYWKAGHEYYIAVDIYVSLDSISSNGRQYFNTMPKFNDPNSIGSYEVMSTVNVGKRGLYKTKAKVNNSISEEHLKSNRLFFQLNNKYDTNSSYRAVIYQVFVVDLGIAGTDEYIDWDYIDEIVERKGIRYVNAVDSALKSAYSDVAGIAKETEKIKTKDIELWGDSLTAQNYGRFILGADVYTHGYGGQTSTYIRDKFLSEFNEDRTQVIWVGRNNYNEVDVVIDDVRDIVSTLKHNDFVIMNPPNGYYGEFGTNGENGTGEMKGGSNHSKFLELEKRLSEEYPSNFLNIRKAVIEGWRMGNVRLLSDFTQPSVGNNVTIEVSDATFLTTYNNHDLDKFGQDFMSKIRIGINGKYDVYKVVEKVDDTHLTVQLEESNRIAVGSTVGNLIDSGGNNAVKYLRVMQNADYMCWLYDTTLSTFRKDGIHMTEDGLKLVAQIVSRKLASMKLL